MGRTRKFQKDNFEGNPNRNKKKNKQKKVWHDPIEEGRNKKQQRFE
jgi:hypothetical protein